MPLSQSSTHFHQTLTALMAADVTSEIPTAYDGSLISAVKHLSEMYQSEPKMAQIQDVTILGWCVDCQIHIIAARVDPNGPDGNVKVIMFMTMSDEADSLYDIHDGTQEISWSEDPEKKEHLTITYKGETKVLFNWATGTKGAA